MTSTTATKAGISTKVFAATTIVLIIIAGAGYGLYYTAVSKPSPKTRIGVTGGFFNGQVVTFQFFENFTCAPAITQLFPGDANATAAANVTSCEAGKPGTFPSNVEPVWGMSPAFAGLSIFGITDFGATPDGFPTYNSTTVFTDCTGMGSTHKCPDHPPLFYSPVIVAVENYLGKRNGVTVGGTTLPEGVMPFPAHTHIIDTEAAGQDIPWNAIAVFVFDPNIFPNPATGKCTATVASNLTNPISNCLTSIANLQSAMATHDSAVSIANANNPMWKALKLDQMPPIQVVIVGASSPSDYRNANSNVDVPFSVTGTNPYPPYLG